MSTLLPDSKRPSALTRDARTRKDPAPPDNRRGAGRLAGTVTVEPIEHLTRYWQAAESGLAWECPFILPPWLGAWWHAFGKGLRGCLYVIREQSAVLGLVPVTMSGDRARLVGDPDLIDYSDFVIAPSCEPEFFSPLFGHLRQEGIKEFTADRIRADSPAISFLRAHSAALGCEVSCRPVDVLYEMDLPDSWEAYLDQLPGKERHETRRKLRRLEDAGTADVRIIENASEVPAAMDTFVTLFRSNRPEKARFMTGPVETFFRTLAAGMAAAGFVRLFALDLNGLPAAMAMCFDHASTVYLYNNGFDQRFSHLSAGLLSKVFSIKDSILRGRKRYNFLRGAEPYKRRLGGRAVRLLRVEVSLR